MQPSRHVHNLRLYLFIMRSFDSWKNGRSKPLEPNFLDGIRIGHDRFIWLKAGDLGINEFRNVGDQGLISMGVLLSVMSQMSIMSEFDTAMQPLVQSWVR